MTTEQAHHVGIGLIQASTRLARINAGPPDHQVGSAVTDPCPSWCDPAEHITPQGGNPAVHESARAEGVELCNPQIARYDDGRPLFIYLNPGGEAFLESHEEARHLVASSSPGSSS